MTKDEITVLEDMILKTGMMSKEDLIRMRFLSILQTYGFINEDMAEKIIFYFVQKKMKNER